MRAPDPARGGHRGIEASNLPGGDRYVRLHYSADPEKTPEWAEEARKGIPRREWNRQMEMREDMYDGEPVYADYRDRWHGDPGAPLGKFSPQGRFFGGWDCGQTLTPAFVLLYVGPVPRPIRAILEVTSPGAEPMEVFAPRVQAALAKRIPGHWDEVEHWCDATVTQRSGANGENAQGAARRFGLRLRAGSNEWQGRYSAVTWLLTDSIDAQTPRFRIENSQCTVLREGFLGAYRIDDAPAGDSVGPGRVLKNRPRKDGFSHVHDALQYAAVAARRAVSAKAAEVQRIRRS